MLIQPGKLTVRRLMPTDIDDVCRISELAGLSKWTRSDLSEELERTDSYMSLALIGTEPVGFIVGRRVPGADDQSSDAELYNIGVLPNFQGKSIGSELLAGFFDWMREQGIINVWLEVRAGNLSAIKFYRRHGFGQIDIRKAYYPDPIEDAIVMQATVGRS